MTTGRTLLTTAQAAAKLGHTVEWLYRHRKALEAKGFPPPIDALGHRYDPVAIDLWLDRQLPAHLTVRPSEAPGGEVIDWAARLRERAQAIATGGRKGRV